MKRKYCIISIILCIVFASCKTDKDPDYKNSGLPIENRVKDLLSRMTLEEKVAQTLCGNNLVSLMTNPDGTFNPEMVKDTLKYGLGGMGAPNMEPRKMVIFINALQKYVIENTKPGIPLLMHTEGLHGHLAIKATSYPQAIALAGTWDTHPGK